MNESFRLFWERLKEVYRRMELRQRVMIAILLALTFGILIWMISWSTQVEYGFLYGGLSPQDAQTAMNKLKEANIPFKLSEQGTRIDIPADLVYTTRITFATEDFGRTPQADGVGFEIFDRTTLGQTEFVQRTVNYTRAMQGELEKTILAITNVENVRVHLVFPEERVFREDQRDPSASVMLRLRLPLSKRQIDGITYLIAYAVEGLTPENVKIIDQDGRVLTQEPKDAEDRFQELSNQQMAMQQQRERQLTANVRSVLEPMVGPNNSTVSVTVELNFDQIETTSERFDPEAQVVRSEEIQTMNETNLGENFARINEHFITNYEVSSQVQRRVNQIGDIKRLSVAASVNYKRERKFEDGQEIIEYIERTAEEMARIEAVVRSAVGYNPDRGDQVAVVNMLFDRSELEDYRSALEREDRLKQYISLGEKGAVFVVLLVLIFVLISQFKKIFEEPEPEEEPEEEAGEELRPAFASGGADEGFYPEGEEGMPMGDGKISFTFKPMRDIEIEQTEAMLLQETIQKFVIDNPEVAVKLIKTWLMDERVTGRKPF